MKKGLLSFFISLSLSFLLTHDLQGQVISFNTQTLGTGYNGGNGSSCISFVIQNNNAFPAILTSVANIYTTATTLANVELWTSTTSIYGVPGAFAGPTWTLAASATNVVTAGGGAQTTVLSGLNVVIPAMTTQRFFLSTPSLQYTNANLVSPYIFTNTGVSLLTGDYSGPGGTVGYGGTLASPIVSRAFTGTVTLNLLSSPCAGQPTAGTASATPVNPCPGTAVALNLTGTTSAANLSFQWYNSPTGVAGTWTPIAGGAMSPFNYTPTVGSTNYFRCVITCLNSSLSDSSTIVGPVTTQPWSPTSPCYCGTSQATSNLYGDILNVTMGTLNNTTDCLAPMTGSQGTGTGIASQRADFTGTVPAPFIYNGLTQNFSMTVGSCGTTLLHGAKIYIDYNHNASFADPGEEVYFSGLTGFAVVPSTVLSGSFVVPAGALPGTTRMRVIAQYLGYQTATTITPCGSYTYGETEDYLVNIIPPAPYDPGIISMTTPSGNCFSASQLVSAQLRNFGSTAIDLSVNPVTVTLNVNGPSGLVQYNAVASTGLLTPYGASGVTVLFPGVNLYAGGTYSLNTSLTISGLVNGNLFNDSLQTPVIKVNYRPTPGPDYQLCQYNSIPFGQGLTASGCANPIYDSVTVTFNLLPCIDNVGATGSGTALNLPANCSNIYAGLFGTAPLPVIPANAFFTQNGKLQVTNLASNFRTEVRFNLYGTQPSGTALFAGCPTGYNVGANNVLQGGLSVGTATNFANLRDITPAQLSNMFSPANNPTNVINLGYWETWNDLPFASDMTINAQGQPTVATLKIYYAYIPASYEWYSVPSGGVNLSSNTPFNPLVTTGSGLTNSNTTGTYTWFTACAGSSNCRVPVNLVINPTPASFQDTLSQCEYAVSSNSAIFDLTTLNNSVSGNNALASVEYYLDEPLFSLVPFPNNDTSSTNFIYSKVFYPATGCYSSDTVLLQVNSLPEFPSSVITGFACAPNAVDVATLINPFSTSPVGTDTLYYNDATFTTLHPNPHNVTVTDTVYVVFATNTNPVCSDTAVAYIDVVPANNYISGQVIGLNYSNPGAYGCMSTVLSDGNSDTIRSSADCKRVAAVTDIPNSISLGNVSACLDIAASTPFHNGQPYLNRTVQITAANSDTAQVCLYFLDQDFQDYNADAAFFGWPLLPTGATMPLNMGNIALTKVSNGDLNTPGHIPTAIPNAAINASYDPSTTVWTVCFPVSGFSYFYLHTQNPGNIPLPVSLLNFSGRRVDGTSQLSWTTSTEQNNSHFVVERSRDGKSFSKLSASIVSKAPNGNSQTALDYGYTDATPFEGHNYYRLQQHDLDGNISHSKVVDVYFGNDMLVNLYPNPVNSLLNVDIQTPKATGAQVKITDATGRTVKVVELSLQAGNNTTQIDLQDLADGVYMVLISNGKGLNFSQTVRKN